MPAPVDEGFSLIQAVPWLISLGSLGFSVYNFRETRKLKAQDRDLDEWKLERNAVYQQLRAFEDTVDVLKALARGQHTVTDLKVEIDKANLAIVTAHGKLVRELERAAVLKAPIGCVFGLEVEQESSWDRLNSYLSEIVDLDDAEQIKSRLGSISLCAGEIGRSIQSACSTRPV